MRVSIWVAAVVAATVLATAPAAAQTAAAPGATQTGRAWVYGNLTALLTPNVGLTLMPGFRYEFDRSGTDAQQHYFDELFVGPVSSLRLGDFTLRGALWYYYTDFPKAKGVYSHNIEVIPSVEYRAGRMRFLERIILHNTVYATVYKTSAERNGFGTVLRNLVQARFEVSPKVGALLGIEPFFGVVEDADTKNQKMTAAGYWLSGLRLNRVYLGIDWQAVPDLTLSPQYVYETTYDTAGKVTLKSHYVYLTVSYVWRVGGA